LCTIRQICNRCTGFVAVTTYTYKLIALHTANACSAEREMSASACTADPIEMTFGLWIWVRPMKHVSDGGQESPSEGTILRWKGTAHCAIQGLSAVSCAIMSELMEMLLGTWTPVGARKHVLDADAHWHHWRIYGWSDWSDDCCCDKLCFCE